MTDTIRKLYWNMWWWLHDVNEDVFVKKAMKVLEGQEVVYLHPEHGGPPRAAIIPIDALPEQEQFLAHTHVEARP